WVPAITKPLSAIASLPVSPDDGKVDISALQAALLQSVGSWDQVPLLTDDNVDGFPCGTLVRYTGMVQDMLNPEYYVGAVQLADGSWVSARFQDQVVDDLKAPVLNDIVTVVGILSIVPELAACCQEDAMDAELAGSHPPTSRCPRLHALAILPGPSPTPAPAPLPPSAIAEARLRTIGLLSLVLGGDDLAAEYLLLQLVGRVHARREDAGVIGTGSLNLTGCPAGQASGPASLSSLGQALALALQALMPRSVCLGLTTSQVLLDETVMSAGTLNEVGVRNLQAVDVLVRTQKVAYDFEFFSLDQEADAPVTVLSCGRSLLKDALGTSLPLAPTAPLAEPESLASMLQTSSLDGVREYLAAVRALDFTIPSHVAEVVEKDLTSARQKDAAITPASLHHLLNVGHEMYSFGWWDDPFSHLRDWQSSALAWLLDAPCRDCSKKHHPSRIAPQKPSWQVARLLAVSHGEAELTAGRWAAVQSMELRRSARCNPTPSA
ncbi:hypothetical protein APUTEX25_000130, partial [Auxenochlorella protothecoides]